MALNRLTDTWVLYCAGYGKAHRGGNKRTSRDKIRQLAANLGPDSLHRQPDRACRGRASPTPASISCGNSLPNLVERGPNSLTGSVIFDPSKIDRLC
jgi:hypothetical protein